MLTQRLNVILYLQKETKIAKYFAIFVSEQK